MKLVFLVVEFSLIFWAITFTSQIKVTRKRVLAYILMIISPATLCFSFIGQWEGIIYIIVSSFIYFYYFYWHSRSIVTLIHIILAQLKYFAIMCFVLYVTIINLKKENHYRSIEFEKEQFTDYMHSLELINNDMQKFRHDYSNILFTMQGYIEINDLEGLKEYFKQHIFTAEEDTLKRYQRLANLSKLQITGLKGLLLTKIF